MLSAAGDDESQGLSSRRSALKLIGTGGIALATGGLWGCASQPAIDVLAPPSTLRPELLRQFEMETGLLVRPSSWISPTDALGKLLSSSARVDLMIGLSDLFTPAIPAAVERGLLTAIDPAQLPAASRTAASFRADKYQDGGRIYSVPLYWGYDTVLYNRGQVAADDPLRNSWGLIFDDRFAGRVSLKDDAHESIMPTALYMGHADPLAMDRADLREVTRFLISKKANFRALWSKFAEATQLMATGEVVAMYGYPLLLQTLRSQGIDIVASRPREGLLLFVQSAFLPSSGASPEGALQWLNFLLRPDVVRKLMEQTAVLSPSSAIMDRLSPEERQRFGYNIVDDGTKLVRLGRPAHLEYWIEAWAEFKAA
jgi:spermidine/putrescine-binding protein